MVLEATESWGVLRFSQDRRESSETFILPMTSCCVNEIKKKEQNPDAHLVKMVNLIGHHQEAAIIQNVTVQVLE